MSVASDQMPSELKPNTPMQSGLETQKYVDRFRVYIGNAIDALLNELRQGNGSTEATQSRVLSLMDFALKTPAFWPQTSDLIQAISPMMERAGRWGEWMHVLELGASLAKQRGDLRAYAEMCIWLGVLQSLLANYDPARGWLQRAEESYKQVGDPRGNARVLWRRAQMERIAGQLDHAQALAEKSLALYGEDELGQANCYTVLGTIAYDRWEWKDSERYFRLALEIYRWQNNLIELAAAYADLGAALYGQRKYPEAVSCYQENLALLTKVDAIARKAVYQLNLSAVHLMMGNAQRAIELGLEIEPYFQRVQDLKRIVMIQTNIGIAYRQLRQWFEAEKWLLSAIYNAKLFRQTTLFVNAVDELGTVYLHSGHPQDAIVQFQEAIDALGTIEDTKARKVYGDAIWAHLNEAQAVIEKDAPSPDLFG